MKKYTIIVAFFSVLIGLNAQSIRTYKLNLPSEIFSGVKTIYIEDINISDSEKWNKTSGTDLKNKLVKMFSDSERGKVKGAESFFDLVTPNIYTISDSKSEADMIISGNVRAKLKGNTSSKLKSKSKTRVHKLPYSVLTYTKIKELTYSFDLTFTSKSGKVLKKYSANNVVFKNNLSFDGAPETDKKDYKLWKGEVSDSAMIPAALAGEFKNIENKHLASLTYVKYSLKKVKKLKDKGLKKEYKRARKLAKRKNYKEAADLYANVADKAANNKAVAIAAKNAGILYMVIGDAVNAEKYLTKADEKKLMNDLNQLKTAIEKLGGKSM